MADKKVKIGNILDNLLPEFITTENELFVEFLKQYYVSEERDYGSIYLVDHLSSFKNVESFAELLIGAINPATGQPFVPIALTEQVLHLDETINVNTTIGFPNQYGLLRIENEIITYTGKTATSFTGCVRGFSGVSSIETSGNQEYLTFSKTDFDDHPKGTLVSNLNFVYLQEFYRKHKYQFLPGFEERQFQNVSVENILSRAKDFFSSKGTETALKILFNVLYAKKVDIIKPFDHTVQPSSAEWVKTDDIIVEAITGNPKKLESTTLSQDSIDNPTASGAVASVDEVFLGIKKYFKISFAPEPSPRFGVGAAPNMNFEISKKTKILQESTGSTVVTVDSTMGFPEAGSFYYYDGIRYNEVTYLSKNYNQFLDCDGIGLPLQPDTEISDIRFVYGFENGDTDKPVTLRVVGTISGIEGKSSTKYFKEGDQITLESFGEKYDNDDVRFNKWLYNNVSYLDVESLDLGALTFTTKAKHYINKFDRVDILRDTGEVVSEDVNVSAVTSETSVRIDPISESLDESLNYVLRKRIGYSVSDLGIESGIHNIQNSFTDNDGNCYVMSSGLPSYPDIQVPSRSVGIETGSINTTGTGEITINDHGFENGEIVYYNPADNTTDTSGVVSSGTYIVKVVNSNTIKLGLTHPAIEKDIYVLFQKVGVSTHTITPIDLYSFELDEEKSLKPQNYFKRFLKNPQDQISNHPISGPIGMALNGIEYYSPIGKDSYSYGQIDNINVISSGSGYDINAIPEFSVDGGSGLIAFANSSGYIESVDLISQGFDYVGTPAVKIQGGNSSGTVLKAQMRGYTHTVSVNDFAVSLPNNTILQTNHKFLNGEEVTYIASGTPIGISSANVGFQTTRLSSGSSYFIHKVNDDSFSLTSTLNDAVNGTKIIDLNNFGTQDHSFRSKKIRRIIDRIDIVERGTKISTRRVEIDSQNYPPKLTKDEFKTFTGINTHQDYIYAKNHGFSNGEVVTYKTTNTITGLDSNSVYKIKVLDQDKIKLAHAGTATTVSSTNYKKEIYVDISGIGAGIHTFGYPEISINIDGVASIGNTSTIPSYYNATATSFITGGIDDIFIRNGGNSFGSSDLINYNKGLSAKLLTGKDAVLKPLINSDGEIAIVYVLNAGSEYTTPPILKVEGSGNFAELKATISDGKITGVIIINKGKNYKGSDTSIVIEPTGDGAKFIPNIHKWYVNDVQRYNSILSNPNYKSKSRDYVRQKSSKFNGEVALVGYYAGKFYRNQFTGNANIDDALDEETDANDLVHSPIVGWAYDGNPIYGPYSTENAFGDPGSIKRMQSSYKLDPISDSTLRPPKANEFFVQDFVYNMGSGDLDEYNGRFCQTPEFKEGRYVYFSTMDQSSEIPSFPYITQKHHNLTDPFNYNYFVNQSDENINTGEYNRMVTHLGINDNFRDYPFLSEYAKSSPNVVVKSTIGSNITGIDILERGHDYKVKEKLALTSDQINAQIREVRGRKIETITTTETENNGLTLSVVNGKVTAIATTDHTYSNGDVIEITGVSTGTYKNIEGFYKVGVASVTSVLTTAIGSTSVTGIVTALNLFDSPRTRKFAVDDILVIGTENMKIIGIDGVNGNYKVSRKENGVETSHLVNANVHRQEYSFNFEVSKKLNDTNFEIGTTEYFNPEASVGVGSQYSSVIVGTAGSFNITKSIPPRAIYIRNHGFRSGDELEYVSYAGSITASHLQGAVGIGTNDPSNFESFGIHQYSNLFAVKLGTDFLGVSTERVGVATNYLHFVAADGDNVKFTKKINKITANSKRRVATILTGKPHGLIPGDKIKLDVTPSVTDEVVFRYNENMRRLIVDPINIDVTGVSTTGISTDVTSAITIEDHDFNTGDAVSYVSGSDPISSLQSRGHIYYAINYSNDKIRLAENYSSATSYPAQHIDFPSVAGSGSFQLAKVDPKIVATKGTKVSIAVSDTTLSNYDVKFYTDKNYKARYESKLIERLGDPGSATPTPAVINVSVASSLPKVLYYKIEGSSANSHKTKDTFTVGESSIIVQDSQYNGSYDIIGSASTTFTVNLQGKVENSSYIQSGLTTAIYSTNSTNAIGGIHSLDIFDYGKNIKSLPVVTSVGTTTGYGAEFAVRSDNIGTILDTEIKFSGIEIPEDKTLTPKAKSQILLTLEDNLLISNVGVTSGGKNYNTSPTVTIPGHPDATFDVKLSGNAVVSVDVIFGSSGLNKDSRVIAVNNPNGISVTSAVSIGNTENRLSIKAPRGGFTNQNPFPFEVGDDVFVENVPILTNTGNGYNSSDYDYKNFTITGINTISGAESITYSIVGFAQSGGVFDSVNNFGTVVKTRDLPTLVPEFKKGIYKKGETVLNQNDSSGTVVEFDSSNDTLKLININGEFKRDDTLVGSSSNFKSTITSLVEYNFDLKVSSSFEDTKTWSNDTGKLNDNQQRLHDNDYYQRFSYSIRGPIPYEIWSEPVNSLAHVSGYKNFSEYEISNVLIPSVGMTTVTTDLSLNIELLNEASVHELFFYDYVSEDTNSTNFSKIVKFDSKIITDFNKSITNKVLMIDDISPQFTGIVTTVGGGIIGLSTFTLLNDSNTMLNHVFNPATDINTSTGVITINEHNFHTGERLVYTQDSGPIGIAATHSVGIGINTTVNLPNEVYVVKVTDNTFKLSMGSSETQFSTPHTIGFATVTGVGTEHSLAVESELALPRGLITIDNMIQSPITRKDVTVGLSSAIGATHAEIYVNDTTNFVGNSLLKVDNEIFKVSSVGIGSTNSLSVERGFMGTSPAAHLVGAALTVLSGDYRIQKGKIHFKDAPYDSSTFNGRIFYRLNYNSNKIIDDISEEFDGTKDKFDLKTNNANSTGINTSYGAFLINNIFQRPFFSDVGSLQNSDYRLLGGAVGAASTIDFTGSLPDDLPKGGIIDQISIGSTAAAGYQVPRAGSASTVFINSSGVVTAVGIGSSGGGSGYLLPPRVSIASTVGSGASVTATITNGAISAFTVVAAGAGYTNTSPPTVIITPPSPYKNMPLTGGSGSGATLDVAVGVGGSILNYELADNGIGYEIDDVLELSGMQFQSVGVSTFPLRVTVASKYQDKFAGWTFGELLELDDFSNEFNGIRKDFYLTRTILNKEFYSIVAEAGSGIILQNNMLLFINDVLQKPGVDYNFTGGTKLTFVTAPDAGSKFKLYFYTGSSSDYQSDDVNQTIKIGDVLRLQKWTNGVVSQTNRTIYELVAADTVETETYGGIGIVTDGTYLRPTMWRKQTSDLIVNGLPVSKQRDYLEPKIFPNTNIIAGVAATHTKIWVKDAWSFNKVDVVGGTGDILMVGVGTTGNAITESISEVTFAGDYCVVTGIKTETTGINTTSPMIVFDVIPDPNIFDLSPGDVTEITRSGITTGDYFVIDKTLIGSGVTAILDSPLNPVVGESTDFINGVYHAHSVVSIGSSGVRISANVQSLSGISTAGLSTYNTTHGCMSWGSMILNRNAGLAKTFTAQTGNGNTGLSTSAYVRRTRQYRLAY